MPGDCTMKSAATMRRWWSTRRPLTISHTTLVGASRSPPACANGFALLSRHCGNCSVFVFSLWSSRTHLFRIVIVQMTMPRVVCTPSLCSTSFSCTFSRPIMTSCSTLGFSPPSISSCLSMKVVVSYDCQPTQSPPLWDQNQRTRAGLMNSVGLLTRMQRIVHSIDFLLDCVIHQRSAFVIVEMLSFWSIVMPRRNASYSIEM
mmetsp:Transcript_13117/g.39659  ORF Transcript_13117/g.39659 Transcript_13117/m.39659 type:complete len:203 (-) Transcript_13117:1378-1986(-)